MAGEAEIAHAGMLTLARESRGMTQRAVCEAMSVLAGEPISQGYVSRAEAGRLQVSGARLQLYADALGYPPSTLCMDSDVHGMGIGLVHHRKKAALGAQALRRIHAVLALARLQLRGLSFAHSTIAEPVHGTPVAGVGPHRFEHIAVTDLDSPADAARSIRGRWGIVAGPVPDMVKVIEQAGGLVLVRDLGTGDLDAVSHWDGGDQAPLFVLNAHAPGDRFRFSLAHELGHIVMHPEPGTTAVQERQADEFAAELLMPATDVGGEFGRGLTLERLLALKHRWGVSMAALARRAVTLATISEWQYRNLMIEMSTLGYRVHEPGAIVRECPRTVPVVASRLTQALGINHAAASAGLLPEEFRALYLSPSTAPTNKAGHDTATGGIADEVPR